MRRLFVYNGSLVRLPIPPARLNNSLIVPHKGVEPLCSYERQSNFLSIVKLLNLFKIIQNLLFKVLQR